MKNTFSIFVFFLTVINYVHASGPDCHTSLDLQLIVDSSGSVKEHNFRALNQLISDQLLNSFQISPTQTRVALVVYSWFVFNIFQLDKYKTKQEVQEAVRNAAYRGYTTKTGKAMEVALETYQSKVRHDPNVLKTCMVFTDGESDDDPLPQAKKWNDFGVKMYAIGIGSGISNKGLLKIAGENGKTIRMTDYKIESIKPILDELKKGICNCIPGKTCNLPDKLHKSDKCVGVNCNNGTCKTKKGKAKAVCHCKLGWQGTTCETPDCIGGCGGHGICTAPNVCVCGDGWGADDCSMAICKQNCSGNGNCIRPETCNCTTGWKGQDCSTPICAKNCSSNGDCIKPDTCHCNKGWDGQDCLIAICPNNCSSHGDCFKPGSCHCKKEWGGIDCSIPSCLNNCTNHGDCIRPNTCECSRGWTGPDCSKPVCKKNCNSHGDCIKPDLCKCDKGWGGAFCTNPTCINNCTNNGICVSPDNCKCKPGWSAEDCSNPVCNHNCNGKGKCIQPNYCSCSGGWKGKDCSERHCDKDCGEHGKCIHLEAKSHSPACLCLEGWTGEDCKIPICQENCNRNGKCVAPDTCDCNVGWKEPKCSQPQCKQDCNGHGTCLRPGLCKCHGIWYGETCSKWKCPKKGGFYQIIPRGKQVDISNCISCPKGFSPVAGDGKCIISTSLHEMEEAHTSPTGAVLKIQGGTWRKVEDCPHGFVVRGYRIRLDADGWKAGWDHEGLTEVDFYCVHKNEPTSKSVFSYRISSGVRRDGVYSDRFWCPDGEFVVGFRQQLFLGGKKVGALNLEVLCGDPLAKEYRTDGLLTTGMTTTAAGAAAWTKPVLCGPHQVACGLQTRTDEDGFWSDDAGVTDVRIRCCPYGSHFAFP